MYTVVGADWVGGTVSQATLGSSTVDIVQPDYASALAKQSSDNSMVACEQNKLKDTDKNQ